MLMRNIKN